MPVAALKSAKQKDFTIPSLAEASPKYAEMIARRQQLLTDASSTDAEIARVEVQIRGVPRELRRAKVAELVGDQIPDAPSATPERLRELQQHARALKDAVSVLDTRIGQERTNASVAICNQVREEHHRRAREVCLKLIDLRQSMLAYAELIDALNAEDVAWSYLGPAQLLALGNPRDNQSRMAIYLRQMVEAGHLDATEVPQAIR
ncbi:hypothetical protein QY049_03590 [Bradyrhizobium sp. WYCCWR 13022]|uniref:hypothetical protein n=1 Tax=unclassified Bradyrhizobium TaxID=2631580 RepID=UPI00263BD198|nr:hypothetical protein [Bradyrhizobium sp. WYCCWR 13022]MDN4982306.1 hypothetical protein [Bradyrhizobium sp. WYCCWR 13022]